MVACVAVGGAIGALARHGVGELIGSVWATFVVNVSGCLLMGVLLATPWARSRWVRPFLGVGVLGGYTTFSAYALDIRVTAAGGDVAMAALYAVATLVCAMAAVWVGMALTRRLVVGS